MKKRKLFPGLLVLILLLAVLAAPASSRAQSALQQDQGMQYELQRTVEIFYSYLGENLNPMHYREGILSPERRDIRIAKFQTDRLNRLPADSIEQVDVDLSNRYQYMFEDGVFLQEDIKAMQDICPTLHYLTPTSLAAFHANGVFGYRVYILRMNINPATGKGLFDYQVDFYKRTGEEDNISYSPYTSVIFTEVEAIRQPDGKWKLYHKDDASHSLLDQINKAMNNPHVQQPRSEAPAPPPVENGGLLNRVMGFFPVAEAKTNKVQGPGRKNSSIQGIGLYLGGGFGGTLPNTRFSDMNGVEENSRASYELEIGYDFSPNVGVFGRYGKANATASTPFTDIDYGISYYNLDFRFSYPIPIANNRAAIVPYAEVGVGRYSISGTGDIPDFSSDRATGFRAAIGSILLVPPFYFGSSYAMNSVQIDTIDFDGGGQGDFGRANFGLISLRAGMFFGH